MDIDFSSLALSPALLEVVEALGFKKPTPIQAECIPVLLAGKDLVAQAQTGSGKTAAFVLPILEKLALATREVAALVVCPTRELSAQVAREFRKLGRRHSGLTVHVLAGGQPVRSQASALEKGVHVVVGTPGRILDHLRRRNLKVHRVSTVVLDEADRMLDMGFQEDVERILKSLPDTRQTLFFSATFPRSIEALSRKYQNEPALISLQAQELQQPDIRQLVVWTETGGKFKALHWVLENHPHESALVFANLKLTVTQIEKWLASAGVSAACIHGDLEQYDRDRVMAKFRNASTRVLVATDVAARGIDIQALDLVVNFDLPSQSEVYVHRIGRTGRAGRAGLAISLCTDREQLKIKTIEQYTGVPILRATRPLPKTSEETVVSQPRGALMATLRISGGRKQKLRPADILGALTGDAGGLSAAEIGIIEIHDNFSYVAVAKSVCGAAQQCLTNGRIKGRKFQIGFVE